MLKKRALPTEATAKDVGGVVEMLSSLAPLFPKPPLDAEEVDDADLIGRGVGGLLLVEAADLIEESPVPVLLLIGTESLVPLLLIVSDLIDSLVPVLLLLPSPLKLLLLSNATSTEAASDTMAGWGILLPLVAPEFIAGEGDLIGAGDDDLIGLGIVATGGTPLPFGRGGAVSTVF